MTKMSLPSQQYRQTIGNHTHWKDNRQRLQMPLGDVIRQLSGQPGRHCANAGRQDAVLAGVQLLTLLSSVTNSCPRMVTAFRAGVKDNASASVTTSEPAKPAVGSAAVYAAELPLVASSAATAVVSAADPTRRSKVILGAGGVFVAAGITLGANYLWRALRSPPENKWDHPKAVVALEPSPPMPVAAARVALPPATSTADPDDVPVLKIEKLYDFSCIDPRADMSNLDILRQIGKTLRSPIQAMAVEALIVNQHVRLHAGCPPQDAIERVNLIASQLDNVLSRILTLLPGSSPLAVIQGILAPVLELIVNDLSTRPVNLKNENDFDKKFISMLMLEIATTRVDKRVEMMNPIRIYQNPTSGHVFFIKNQVKVKTGQQWVEVYLDENWNPYIVDSGRKMIYFDLKKYGWRCLPDSESEKYSIENRKSIQQFKISPSDIKRGRVVYPNEYSFTVKVGTRGVHRYIIMNFDFVDVFRDNTGGNFIYHPVRAGIRGKVIVYGESGYYFERESTELTPDLERILASGGIPFTVGRDKTTISKDGFSYDDFQNAYIKYKDLYYPVTCDDIGFYIKSWSGEEYYLEYKDEKLSVVEAISPQFGELIKTSGGNFITKALMGKLFYTGKRISHTGYVIEDGLRIKSSYGTDLISVNGYFYEISGEIDDDILFFAIKNVDPLKKDILIYRTEDGFFESEFKEENTHNYRLEQNCRLRRSPVSTGTDTCDRIFLSTHIRNILHEKYQAQVNELDLGFFSGFPNTFIDVRTNKLYFKFGEVYFKCTLIPTVHTKLRTKTLSIYYTSGPMCFTCNSEIIRVVYDEERGEIRIKSEEEEFIRRTKTSLLTSKTYLSGKTLPGRQDLISIIDSVRGKKKFVPVTFPAGHNLPKTEIQIDEKINKLFFAGDENWIMASLNDAIKSEELHLRGSAYYIHNHINFAARVLKETIKELEIKSLNSLTYLSIVLGTKNQLFLEAVAASLVKKFIRIRNNINSAEYLLCYSQKTALPAVVAEVDDQRDRDMQDVDAPDLSQVHWESNLNKKERGKGHVAFTLSTEDNRIWINADKLYFTDPTHPDISLHDGPAVKAYMTLIHEACHKEDMARDLTYVSIEGGDLIPILDAVEEVSTKLSRSEFSGNAALMTLVNKYFDINSEYSSVDRRFLLRSANLQYIFDNDPHFRATILYSIPDFLAIHARDLFQNTGVNLST